MPTGWWTWRRSTPVLKRLVADLSLDNQILKEAASGNS